MERFATAGTIYQEAIAEANIPLEGMRKLIKQEIKDKKGNFSCTLIFNTKRPILNIIVGELEQAGYSVRTCLLDPNKSTYTIEINWDIQEIEKLKLNKQRVY